MPTESDPTHADLVRQQVRELFRRAAAIAAAVAETCGLHPTDVRALRALDAAGSRPLTAGELGTELGLSSASVTALVDRLVAAQLVRRERDPDDGRRVLIVLSEVARRLGQTELAPIAANLGRAIEASDDAELLVVHRFLDDLLDEQAGH